MIPNNTTLQIEFKRRQQCNKFAIFITKRLKGFFDGKAERCVWMKFESFETREKIKTTILKAVPKCEIKYRDSGVDYLFVN